MQCGDKFAQLVTGKYLQIRHYWWYNTRWLVLEWLISQIMEQIFTKLLAFLSLYVFPGSINSVHTLIQLLVMYLNHCIRRERKMGCICLYLFCNSCFTFWVLFLDYCSICWIFCKQNTWNISRRHSNAIIVLKKFLLQSSLR